MESSTIYLIISLFLLLLLLILQVLKLLGIVDYQYEFSKTSKFVKDFTLYDKMLLPTEILVLIFILLFNVSKIISLILIGVIIFDFYLKSKRKKQGKDYMSIQKSMFNVKINESIKLIAFTFAAMFALVYLLILI